MVGNLYRQDKETLVNSTICTVYQYTFKYCILYRRKDKIEYALQCIGIDLSLDVIC